VIVDIGDDCAVLESSGKTWQLVSTDALVETVHFDLKSIRPEQLGRKSLAVNISDIAAMGGVPHTAVIALGIPAGISLNFLDRFYKGISEQCQQFGLHLVGGDTVASPKHFFINITILGDVGKKRLFTRSGAKPGDAIFVTGHLGDSALGLHLIQSRKKKWQGSGKWQKALKKNHLDPVPRLEQSRRLSRSKARVSAMIDLSDGLVQDLGHILGASQVGANLQENCLPLSSSLTGLCSHNHLNPFDFALSGGEDYELLFTLHPDDVKNLNRQFLTADVPVTQIGEITSEPGIRISRTDGSNEILENAMGFDHFRKKP
jgi:thiamine-monophosphate kinase